MFCSVPMKNILELSFYFETKVNQINKRFLKP